MSGGVRWNVGDELDASDACFVMGGTTRSVWDSLSGVREREA